MRLRGELYREALGIHRSAWLGVVEASDENERFRRQFKGSELGVRIHVLQTIRRFSLAAKPRQRIAAVCRLTDRPTASHPSARPTRATHAILP